ncbi:hypothetical protein B5F83_05575 [Muribaculum sp. An289]|uniref:hypothetical protein n=1 Tax=unclassified Muribaculum TaxID=2622126 RepID=UPI000B370922|nr:MULTISPECIES: hypothetical protein [unclassified Muribaculum]OUO37229.1 hypothetical protein B5F83_05575 [Muribaculum sp. An289]OUO43128.1 hypothetical protein B5F81_04990 [Muribaculum sp. An287]
MKVLYDIAVTGLGIIGSCHTVTVISKGRIAHSRIYVPAKPVGSKGIPLVSGPPAQLNRFQGIFERLHVIFRKKIYLGQMYIVAALYVVVRKRLAQNVYFQSIGKPRRIPP